jgi:two-component system LytT family sensor kinase
MKKYIAILILLFSCSTFSFAQKETAAELEQKLIEATNDSIRIFCHKELCKRYRASQPDKHIAHTRSGMNLAKANKDILHTVFFYKDFGDYFLNQSNIDSAFFHYEQSIDFSKKLDDKKAYIGTIAAYANALNKNGDFEKAAKIYYEAITICDEIQFHDGLISCYFGIATTYEYQKDYQKALIYIEKSIPLCSKIDERRQPSCNGAVYSNLSAFHYHLEKYEKSIEYGLEAIQIKKDAKFLMSLDQSYTNVANAYSKLGDKANAIKYYEQAYQISTKLKKTSGRIQACSKLADLYIEQNNVVAAGVMIDTLENIITKTKNPALLMNYYRVQTKYNKQTKNYIESLEFYDKAVKIKDSLTTEEKIQAITELETKYETDKLKQEKLIEVERAKKNRNLFIISIIAGLLLLSLSFLYIYQQKLKKRAELAEIKLSESENKLKLERKLNNAEMKAIKAQMNPHFLFNAFNSIQEFIIMNNRELASNYLGKFADLMRLYLDHSREKTIPLQEEINATELYLELERIRFEEKLNYSINVAKNVDKSRTYLPPMLIQPFIENSLKHGLLHKKNDRKLDIRFAMIGNVLHCSIADNGIGRHKSALLNARKLKKHKSFATSATQNRIELLNVGREQDITLQIIDLMDDNNEAVGTKVIIQIPNENV